ncbi:MAG: F0F1 ATP synthase subunit A [Alphaproteobacteria bacterium]|nr:F0F1 ATP synthase subunit A [Alphaproteobacteria bacterium]
MSNPVEQFQIHPLHPSLQFHIGSVDVSFTNSALWMLIGVVLSTVLLSVASKKRALVPGRMQMFAESLYEFIANMVRDNIGSEGRRYFPLIFTLFVMVMLGNTMGLIPYSFTYTSHLIVTLAMAMLIFVMVLVLGIARHGFHFFSFFLPPGVPVWLIPLIVPIEILSFAIRPVTLSVRLFANMIAGHIMLKVFAGFSVGMVAAFGTWGYAAGAVPMLFNTVLIGFELLIAFLQAYVFTVLSCIYLKDTIHIDH